MIGGKVLDSSALAAYVRGASIALLAWLATAQDQGSVLYVPSLALDEVHNVYPDAGELLHRLLDHPWVVEGGPDRPEVAAFLAEAGVFDPTAAQVILVARQRGWPVLSADPGRLQRIAPDLDVDLL